ncbi:MAG: NAD-dependent epimerase/dehydratase family protein [Patescibacteria group bacterium]
MPFDVKEFQDARVLITGGSGFLGTHLIKKLQILGTREIVSVHQGKKAHDIPSGVIDCVCDMSKPESIDRVRAMGNVDYIFNLAGLSDQRMLHPHPQDLWNANVISLIHLSGAIDWSKVKGAVHMGTTAEYGNQEVPFREDQRPLPTSPYGWSKAAATQYAVMMVQGGYAKWCVARQFTGYGPGQTTGFIVDLTRALKRGETFMVSSSHVTRDPIFISDTIEGLIRLAYCSRASGEIMNLCPGKEISIGEIAEMVHSIAGVGRIELAQGEPRKGDFLRSWGSTEKIEQFLGWKPHISLEEGLRITVPTILDI